MNKQVTQFWDERYSAKQYVYGEAPNVYLEQKLATLQPGTALFPAEGEGRNAVYAATLGWDVTAFDSSIAGQKKALALANHKQTAINYVVADVETFTAPAHSFDALVLIYAHFPAEQRRMYHQQLAGYLKPGGLLILEGFSKQHTVNQADNPQAGGPKDATMLFELDTLKKDFEGFEFLEAEETSTTLHEGEFHQGKAAVVRIFARKK